ncbi:MAG TPA: hypothetical protein PLF04_10250 [Candidatus Fermentibacter daniensis]|nr:MAG: hypothetical protein BWX47_01621 [candidate division Hyd24-12 bacterium ADurb.Bin004]HOZ18693.1 hypothetical protein [Candidatus Fermentibacter daniensis]HPH40659.1 hypothetical protein [Candidatus Fermentibacter daniensis]
MGSFAVLLLYAATVMHTPDGGLMLDRPVYVPGSDDVLSYDDGTASWICWEGSSRGVWFNSVDFLGVSASWEAFETEFWFYHHSSYPWDTASFYAEIWNGGVSGPASLLDQTSVTASHCAAVYAVYSPHVVCEDQFWVLVNTEMSAGGWPSVLGDSTAPPVVHSFCDMVPWELGDFLIRTDGWFLGGDLEASTWAGIKALFD